MSAFYNEIDPFAAEWLRELIKAGAIAPGIVDERSIEDIAPDELDGFTQCHFFAGIGVWSYALRQAGWPDDRPVWTGSTPCQPFSSAGKGKGFKDERHLWPEFYRLISQCRPPVCFGEQVASKDGLAWVELVQADMEGSGYAFGAVDTCAAGFGAPHIRQRLYWVGADTLGNSSGKGLEGRGGFIKKSVPQRRERTDGYNPTTSSTCGLAHADNAGRQLLTHAEPAGICRKTLTESEQVQQLGTDCPSVCRVANAESAGRTDGEEISGSSRQVSCAGKPLLGVGYCSTACERPGPTNGFWRDADWLLCRDGKWRAVEPEIFPLAPRSSRNVGLLRGAGNAINAEAAKAFITAFMEAA